MRGARAQEGEEDVREGGAAWPRALGPDVDSEASMQGQQVGHDR